MSTHIDAIQMRRVLGRDDWYPPEPYGEDGWWIDRRDGSARIIASCAPAGDGDEWIHASISRRDGIPAYDDLVLLHRAVFGDGWAYQVFAPPDEHINIHGRCLHLWGRIDGKPALPDFTYGKGTI